MPKKIELPHSLAQLVSDPSKIQDAINLLNALASIEVVLVPASSTAPLVRGERQIQGEPPNLVLPIPIQCASPIADSVANAASVSAQLNTLLAQLRVTRILPQ